MISKNVQKIPLLDYVTPDFNFLLSQVKRKEAASKNETKIPFLDYITPDFNFPLSKVKRKEEATKNVPKIPLLRIRKNGAPKS